MAEEQKAEEQKQDKKLPYGEHPTENLTPLHELQHAALENNHSQFRELINAHPDLEKYRFSTIDEITDALTDEILGV